MRKLSFILLFSALCFSCGNNNKSPKTNEEPVTTQVKEESKNQFKDVHVLEVGDNLSVAGFNISVDYADIVTELPAPFDETIHANGYFLVMTFLVKNESSRQEAASTKVRIDVVNSDGLIQKHLDPFSVKVKDEYDNFDILVVPQGYSKRAYAVFEIPDKSDYYISFIGDGGRSIASLKNIIK